MTTNEDEPLTYYKAVSLLNRAAEEKGEDFVYEARKTEDGHQTCMYFNKEEPDCIIGHVLHYLGVEVPEGRNYDQVDLLIEQGVLHVEDERTANLLLLTQENQDGGQAWGDAVRDAVWWS